MTTNKKLINTFYIVSLLAIVFIVSLPAFRSGIVDGHDLHFHTGRIEAIAHELKLGNFPVRYESEAWNGYGYVSTTYYGNIFLYLPALLYMAGLPLYKAYNAYVILVNLATALIGYYSFKGIFKEGRWALLATLIYTMSGYYISNVYVRCAAGEYTAMAFTPLVAYGVYRIYYEKHENIIIAVLPLVIGASGIVQSHILTTEMVAMTVILFALINIKETIAHIREIALAAIAIVLINLFFLWPFLDAYIGADLFVKGSTVGQNIRAFGLYPNQLFGLFVKGNGSAWEWTSVDEEYTKLGILHVICFLLMVVYLIIKRKEKGNKPVKTAFALGIIAAWMSSVYFPWEIFTGDNPIANIMRAVQYPSRYLLIQTICYTICGVFAMKKLADRNFVKLLVCFGALGLISCAIFDYTLVSSIKTVNYATAEANWADGLYLPMTTDRSQFENNDVVHIDDQHILLAKTDFDNLKVFDDKGNLLSHDRGENNRMLVEVPASYEGQLYVRYIEPVSYRIAEIISLISLVAIIAGGLRKKNEIAG